jgi:hypothetical protein
MKERKAALLHFHSFKAMREIAELLCTYGRTEETIIHGIPAHAAPNAEPAIRLEGHRMADGLRQSLIDYADWRAMGEIQADWSRLSSSAAAIRLAVKSFRFSGEDRFAMDGAVTVLGALDD